MTVNDPHDPHDPRDNGLDNRDDRLLAHLRAADPAAGLAPADPASVAGLARTAMADAGPSRRGLGAFASTGPAPRYRVPRLLAAAAVVVVAGVGVWAVAGPDDEADVGPSVAIDPAPTAPATPTAPGATDPSDTDPSDTEQSATIPGAGEDTRTVLRVPGTAAAKCMVPNADVLRSQDLAFEGTVIAVDGLAADLSTSEVYAGKVTDQVRVQAPSPEMSLLLSGVQFEVGSTYLVSATGGQVTLCGLSAEATPELATLYAEAYGR